MLLSPNRHYLALVIAEEGHEVLYVLDADLLAITGNSRTLFVRGIYPGAISIECWKNHFLIFQSDQDLANGWHQLETRLTDKLNYFQLNITDGDVQAIRLSNCNKLSAEIAFPT